MYFELLLRNYLKPRYGEKSVDDMCISTSLTDLYTCLLVYHLGFLNWVWCHIHFTYRNYLAVVQAYGWEDDVRHEYAGVAARSILKKLESAPLSSPFSQDE